MLVFMVIPMFIIALRFQTAPVYINFTNKLNSFVAPFAFIIIFQAHHLDIKLLGVLVGWINF